MVRADEPAKDTVVLSVCGELTIWCRSGCASLHAPGFDGEAWGYGDLVEVAEQVVEAHETLCVEQSHAVPANTVPANTVPANTVPAETAPAKTGTRVHA